MASPDAQSATPDAPQGAFRVSKEVNLARARLFHMVAELRANPNSPTAEREVLAYVGVLDRLGDDGKTLRQKYTDLLDGKAGTRRRRRR